MKHYTYTHDDIMRAIVVLISISHDVIDDARQCIVNQNANDIDDIETHDACYEYIDSAKSICNTIDVLRHYHNASRNDGHVS